MLRRLDFLEDEPEESEELTAYNKANGKIGRIYEPIIGLDKLVIKVSDNGIGLENNR